MFYWFRVFKIYFFFATKDKKNRTFAQNTSWLFGGGELTHWQASRYLAHDKYPEAQVYLESLKK